MADISVHRTRPPLTETTNRVNSPQTSTEPSSRYKPYNDRYRAPVEQRASSASSAGANRQPDLRVTPAPLASNPPMVVSSGPPPQSADESKRLSQASCDSTSSSRSKKSYKTHIGPWQLGRTLGKGSSARVRLCRHANTNQLAAVKIVNRRMAYLIQDSSMAALAKWDNNLPAKINGEMRVPMSIEREVAILKLIEHPHIMKLYDIWENRSEIYLILEYIDQGDLFNYINNRGRLSEEVALYFFRQIMSAITYCHSFNICHRDLKPENILITADSKIKIADFGMAALHQTDNHQLATACGSPHYAAPELLKNRQYRGDRADIWSLGVILYAMLSATLPFDDPDFRVMMSKTKKGQYEMPKNLSPEAEDLIRRMLQVNPDRRISVKEIWRHPLVQKYSYLDGYGENNGQPPDLRKGFQYNPVAQEQIDPQLLRQLRSMWHMFSESDLTLKLTCKEPNDQKAFYWLLHTYREKQLEDFRPELAHSTSDYHHLKPTIWKKRVSTCQFAQPGANGHGRSVSRFTVISNAAETESETVTSYDPYRGSRILGPNGSQVSHAKITIHRDRPSSSGNGSTRTQSVTNTRRVRSSSARALMSGRPASSKGSMSSLRSGRQGTPGPPSLRNKRAVDFSQARKRSNLAPSSKQMSKLSKDAVVSKKEEGAGKHHIVPKRSVSPELPAPVQGFYPMAKGAPQPKIKTNDPEAFLTEELRHFSSNIAKDCDEAFKSSLTEDNSIAGSLADDDRRRRGSPFAFSLDTTPETTPVTDVSAKPWDSRPLPPLPSERTLQSDSWGATSTPTSIEPSRENSKELESPCERVAATMPFVPLGRTGDRRTVSAPVQTHVNNRKALAMPSINEDKAVNAVSGDKARIVSAPPHTPPKGAKGRGAEYLGEVETSIRVVNSPSGSSPVNIPRPLNVRKKTAVTVSSRNASESTSGNTDDGVQRRSSQSQELQSALKKKMWFKRLSKTEFENKEANASRSRDQSTFMGSDHSPEGEADSTGRVSKKKNFGFPFWKNHKAADMSIDWAEESVPATDDDSLVRMTSVPNSNKRDSSSSSHRNIEVKQNWLARLFRVKPATSHLCMAMSRRRARQEAVILLRDWKKYGIRGIQVDKARNIIFARVGPKNYLNLKEVEFAAEVMTVIEHGKNQPLSIIRFTQERGAASSFHKVVDTMRMVFESRNLLVADARKQKMMIKTLNA